jgi:hypothetical protein
MNREKSEIRNAIKNGFFYEEIYRINENEVEIQPEIVATVEKPKTDKETNPAPLFSIAAEPEIIKHPELPVNEAPSVDITQNDEDKIKPDFEAEANIAGNIDQVEYFGGNKKGVAIIVNYPDERWIHFKDKIILERILASAKLSFDDVALINTQFYKPESLEELHQKINTTKLIGFGVNAPFLSEFKREEPQKSPYTAVFLMNSNLEEIAMDHNKKRILWNHIKIMFNIG